MLCTGPTGPTGAKQCSYSVAVVSSFVKKTINLHMEMPTIISILLISSFLPSFVIVLCVGMCHHLSANVELHRQMPPSLGNCHHLSANVELHRQVPPSLGNGHHLSGYVEAHMQHSNHLKCHLFMCKWDGRIETGWLAGLLLPWGMSINR